MPVFYSNPRLTAEFTNWPYGALRTTATFSVEKTPGRGERAVRVTIDPKTGRPTAPKKLTYARKVRIVDGDDGKTYLIEKTLYGFVSVMRSDMKFQHETLHEDNERFAAVDALFAVPV
jgi:hypothetical protein